MRTILDALAALILAGGVILLIQSLGEQECNAAVLAHSGYAKCY